MILHGFKKNVLKDIIRYYVNTTGKSYEDFILGVQKAKGVAIDNLDYSDWLAVKSYELLNKYEITLAECIENKDIIRSAIKEDQSRLDGEFYTPEVWCVEGREYLKRMLGDLWGKAYIWDASCYTMDTEILTHRGWVTYDELRDDDYVYALNPDTLEGEFVRFHSRFKKYVNEELIHFHGKAVDLLVTKDHSMFVKNRKRHGKEPKYELRTALEVYNHLNSSPSGGNQLRIPSAARLYNIDNKENYDEKEGLFWKLVGFYIGDGYVQRNESNGEINAIAFKLHKDRKIEFLENLLNSLGLQYFVYDYRDKNDGIKFMVKSKRLLELVEFKIGSGFDNKRIPFDEIPFIYYEDLLDGLINSDGYVNETGFRLYTSNKGLAEDIELLLHVLGYSVHTVVRDRDIYKMDGDWVSINYDIYASTMVQHNLTCFNTELVHYEGYVWDITLEKYHVFKVRRNGKSVFCGNCGTGNLLKSIDYPYDKLFMSTILDEDVRLVKSIMPNVEVFQLDFLEGIDYDDRNRFFSERLPERLVKVLENDEPLVFYMNPPYKVMDSNSSDVGAYMSSIGMAKCALDIFHQFMFRICMIKRFYNLTNLYLGIFGPLTMFHSKMLEPLYEEFKRDFKFVDGMCFSAGDFSGTSESVGWVVGYTTWRCKKDGEEDKSIVLDAKVVDQNDNITVIGKRLVTAVDKSLHDWVRPKDVIRYDDVLPVITTFTNMTGNTTPVPKHALGYLMSSNYVIRATRRAAVSTLPTPDGIPITEENFWRCVASFTARRCYAGRPNPYNNCQYYSQPDESVEGYQEWLADALIVFLFDYSVHFTAYRNLEVGGHVYNIANRMFPLRKEIVRQVVSDPVILEDMEKHPAENEFILSVLEKTQSKLSKEAFEMYEFGLKALLETLYGNVRKEKGYINWTNAWDAGFLACRALFTPEMEDRYGYLMSRLKHKLFDGVYKFGFMMDTAYPIEEYLQDEEG